MCVCVIRSKFLQIPEKYRTNLRLPVLAEFPEKNSWKKKGNKKKNKWNNNRMWWYKIIFINDSTKNGVRRGMKETRLKWIIGWNQLCVCPFESWSWLGFLLTNCLNSPQKLRPKKPKLPFLLLLCYNCIIWHCDQPIWFCHVTLTTF